ncbi:MAG: YdcF family protein [Kordiimonadaceae bacterium]|nr:YdcF family protein [Kordiimonadaceae bacterium]
MSKRPSASTMFFQLLFYGTIAWCLGLTLFFIRLPIPLDHSPHKADAIVVLTGSSGRLEVGLSLLKSGAAKRLLVSGVHPDVVKNELSQLTGAAPSLFKCCVDLDYAARNTFENATETANWAKTHNFDTLILVTADYHMQRSRVLFNRAMPHINIMAYPVSGPVGFGTLAREYSKYLVILLQEAFAQQQ